MKTFIFTLLSLFFWQINTSACNMACNDYINVSVDQDGNATFVPDMGLEGNYTTCNPDFVVRLETLWGEIIFDYAPTFTMTCEMLGEHTFRILDKNSGNSCWGTLNLEDKIDACDGSSTGSTGCSLACNADVVLALTGGTANPIPTAKLYAASPLDGDYSGCDLDLEIKISDLNGNTIYSYAPFVIVDCNDIGNYFYTVRDNNTGNLCWGNLTIEDKLNACGSSGGGNSNCTFAVNDLINISIGATDSDPNPHAAITWDMLVEGSFDISICDIDFEIKIEDLNGNVVRDWARTQKLYCENIGEYFYTIRDMGTSNEAWGMLSVEDKIPLCGNPFGISTIKNCEGFDIVMNDDHFLRQMNDCDFEIYDGHFESGVNNFEIRTSPSNVLDARTIDVVVFQKSLQDVFEHPAEAIAADLDGNGTVSTDDMLGLRLNIIGLNDYADLKLYKFYPTDYQFPNNFNPYNFENTFTFADVDESFIKDGNLEFTVVKLGDVSGANLNSNISHSKNLANLSYTDKYLEAGESYTIQFNLEGDENIVGVSTGLEFNDAFIEDFDSEYADDLILNASDQDIRISFIPNGNTMQFSFDMEITATKSGLLSEQIQLSSKIVNDMVNSSLEISEIVLNAIPSSTIENDISNEISVFPNPSSQTVNIIFSDQLNDKTKILEFFDQTGKRIQQVSTSNNTLQIDRPAGYNGMMIMQITSDSYIATKKLVFTN